MADWFRITTAKHNKKKTPLLTNFSCFGILKSDITGSLADTLGTLNPFRYRGYIYDEETALYYCQSRYYDPEIGRFINGDGIIAGVGYVQGYNLFAYCNNNPVMAVDYSGQSPIVIPILEKLIPWIIGIGVTILGTATLVDGGTVSIPWPDGQIFPFLNRGTKALPKTGEIDDKFTDAFPISDADTTTKPRTESQDRIWFAHHDSEKKAIIRGKSVTMNEAVTYLAAGIPQSFICIDYETAVQLTNIWGRKRHYEIDKGKEGVEGYYYHFHIDKNHHGDPHVWHGGGKGTWVNIQ